MKTSKSSVLEIISSIIKVNDVIVVKIFYAFEKEVITAKNYEKVIKQYRKKILKNLKTGKYEQYVPFFPVLDLFKKSNEVNLANLSISSGQRYAFSSLKKIDDLPKEQKIGNRILWDLHSGESNSSKYKLHNYERFLEYIKKDKDILKLIDTIGGTLSIQNYGNRNLEKQKQNILNVPDEFYSLTQSDDIRNIFYLELINLTEKDLETIFFKRVVDKNLSTYLLRKEQQIDVPNLLVPNDAERKRGAIVVLIDTSGSMLGISEIISKYIAVLISEICIPSRRSLILMSFSIENFYMEINHYESLSVIRDKIMKFLNTSYYGGTSIDSSLDEALHKISTREEFFYSDILILSDFLFKSPVMSTATVEYYKGFKERGNRIIGLEISTSNNRKRKIYSYLDEHYIYFFNWKNTRNLLEKFEADFLLESTYNFENDKEKIKFTGFLRKIYPLS